MKDLEYLKSLIDKVESLQHDYGVVTKKIHDLKFEIAELASELLVNNNEHNHNNINFLNKQGCKISSDVGYGRINTNKGVIFYVFKR